MKDIPMFTTENGVASLFLQEIPYSGVARVKIQASEAPQALLEECVGFCRACGAESIHATGHSCLEDYPFVTAIWELCGEIGEETDAALFPAQAETVEKWRTIANERMQGVDNAAWLTEKSCQEFAQQGRAYFVHRDGKLLGIGLIGEASIELVASVVPGAGADVVRALASILPEIPIHLTVASTNTRALRLYERLGFVKVKELSKWYKII